MFLNFSVFCFLVQLGYNVCLEDVLYEVEFEQDPSKEVNYFAYGSNMLKKRMKQHVKNVRYKGIAVLKNFRLDFDTYVAKWNGAVATVAEDPGGEVWGVLWGMSKADADIFSSRQVNSSKLYQHHYVKVFTPDMEERIAFTHVAKRMPRKLPPWMILPNERRPSASYLKILITAALENNFPKHYMKFLSEVPYNGNGADEVPSRRFAKPNIDGNLQHLQFKIKFNL